MTQLASTIFSYLLGFLRSRHDLGLEILALRQRRRTSDHAAGRVRTLRII